MIMLNMANGFNWLVLKLVHISDYRYLAVVRKEINTTDNASE